MPEKVNFCKFTNETRNGIEDASAHSGLKFIAAVNGACAGGGYELALACDEIVMVDDRSTPVSLPEVPLLGVLPGTGGLTRARRQAQGAARSRRCVLHHAPKGCAPTAPRPGGSSITSRRPPGSGSSSRSAPAGWPRQSDRPGRARRGRAHTARTQRRRARLPVPVGGRSTSRADDGSRP